MSSAALSSVDGMTKPRSRARPEAATPIQPTFKGAAATDYINRAEVYRGTMSVVWHAMCKRTRQSVMLKAYLLGTTDEKGIGAARREVRLLRSLAGVAGVVQLLEAFEDADAVYLALEDCAKGDLYQKLHRNGGRMHPEAVAGEVLAPLLDTLAALHSRGIVHRDIKPENIFFCRDGSLRLGDFGLAMDMKKERPRSRAGTLDYMAPEIVSKVSPAEPAAGEGATGGKPPAAPAYDEKVDVWSVGVLAYELLVGKPPFASKDEEETKRRIVDYGHGAPDTSAGGSGQAAAAGDVLKIHGEIPVPDSVPPEAVDFIRAALAPRPSARPSAAELACHPFLAAHAKLADVAVVPVS